MSDNPMNEAMERAARALAPRRWAVMDSYLEQAKRQYAKSKAGYDPEAFKDTQSLQQAKAAITAFLRAAPVSEGMVWAGIEALDRCEKAMRDRNASNHPEDMPDYDQGDLVTQAHKAMSTQLADEIEGMSNGQ